MDVNAQLSRLSKDIEGNLYTDELYKVMYATDASVYKKKPLAVAIPKTNEDLKKIIVFANTNSIGLVPRATGTSLAGQCVGNDIIVDISKHFTNIIDFDPVTKTVTVQPGVIRDELNEFLKPYGLFFGPNTSTSNRCTIGGMVGNNSSGTTSIQYGVTRDKVLSITGYLSDASEVTFSKLSKTAFSEKIQLQTLEGKIYHKLYDMLSNVGNRENIIKEFPNPKIHRRNTGYALDALINTNVFSEDKEEEFNLCKLLTGSEGTLVFTTSVTLQLEEIPPKLEAMVVTHYKSITSCLRDVPELMKHRLFTCEMMDRVILDCTKDNKEQLANSFFVKGNPEALLMLELRSNDTDDLQKQIDELITTIKSTNNSYAHPVLYGDDIQKALTLRKAGLGLLGNIVGDKKAVACIEDTAVTIEDLPQFIEEFTAIMNTYKQEAVYYAHAGAGEIHLRPILDLKKASDVVLFREITTAVAKLTKKYKGSFSGEHGDGIVRAEFIPLMIGDKNYELLKEVKQTFDPKSIFNPGKIVNPYPMDSSFRYNENHVTPEIDTLLDFSDTLGIVRATEKCNGSGDCRKTEKASGTMCPSYHATKDEKDSTRGRANVFREVLNNNNAANKFNSEILKEALRLCLSCKACATECPSSVDMATLKAEFQYQYQESNSYKLKDKLIAHNTKLNKLGSAFPKLFNMVSNTGVVKRFMGIAPQRSIPKIANKTFRKKLIELRNLDHDVSEDSIVLLVDEFTFYTEPEIAIQAYEALKTLTFKVKLIILESGRTYLSKGFLKEAKELVHHNLSFLEEQKLTNCPIIGIEPSAILSFRDEYLKLSSDKNFAKSIALNTYLFEEFISLKIKEGIINKSQFIDDHKKIKIHNHCHQKALSNQKVTFDMLNIAENYEVSIINSGCCGMAGSFGYDANNYSLSMKIANLKLFPSINKSENNVLIAANGTSCRHQIKDGLAKTAYHPITIFKEALKNPYFFK